MILFCCSLNNYWWLKLLYTIHVFFVCFKPRKENGRCVKNPDILSNIQFLVGFLVPHNVIFWFFYFFFFFFFFLYFELLLDTICWKEIPVVRKQHKNLDKDLCIKKSSKRNVFTYKTCWKYFLLKKSGQDFCLHNEQ